MISYEWVLLVVIELGNYEQLGIAKVILPTKQACYEAEMDVRNDIINRNGTVITAYCFKR